MTSIDGPLSVYNLTACDCIIIIWHMICTLCRKLYTEAHFVKMVFFNFFFYLVTSPSAFIWFGSLGPINNLSVIKGRVFLGWISTKLGLMFLLKDTTQWRRWGSNLWPLGPETSALPLSHCAPNKPFCNWVNSIDNPESLYLWKVQILLNLKRNS